MKNEVNAARDLGYSIRMLAFELSRLTWYEWKTPLPNPTSIDPDDDGEPGASVPRGTAEDGEPEA